MFAMKKVNTKRKNNLKEIVAAVNPNMPPRRNSKLTRIIASCDAVALREYMDTRPRDVVMRTDAWGRGAMYDAIVIGDVNMVRMLVEYGFGVGACDAHSGATTLHLSASEGNTETLCYLLERADAGEYINATDNEGLTPLYYAMLFLHDDTVGVLTDNYVCAMVLIENGARFCPRMQMLPHELRYMLCALIRHIHDSCVNGYDPAQDTKIANMKQFVMDAIAAYPGLYVVR